MILRKMSWLNDIFAKKMVCLLVTFVLLAVTNMPGCVVLLISVLVSLSPR